MLPREGGILLSISDRDKPEAVPIIRKLAGIGYKLYATEGTAAMLSAMGLPVTMTTKKLSEGHPNVLDTITGGMVQGVINTVTSSGTVMRDGFCDSAYCRGAAHPLLYLTGYGAGSGGHPGPGQKRLSCAALASYRNRRQP